MVLLCCWSANGLQHSLTHISHFHSMTHRLTHTHTFLFSHSRTDTHIFTWAVSWFKNGCENMRFNRFIYTERTNWWICNVTLRRRSGRVWEKRDKQWLAGRNKSKGSESEWEAFLPILEDMRLGGRPHVGRVVSRSGKSRARAGRWVANDLVDVKELKSCLRGLLRSLL